MDKDGNRWRNKNMLCYCIKCGRLAEWYANEEKNVIFVIIHFDQYQMNIWKKKEKDQ